MNGKLNGKINWSITWIKKLDGKWMVLVFVMNKWMNYDGKKCGWNFDPRDGWRITWWHIDDEFLDYHGGWNLETRWSNRVQVQYSRFKGHTVASSILPDCQWEASWLPSWIDILSSSKFNAIK